MILDGDLTVKPEELSKFWNKISSGEAEFINGTRLIYPMERDAMRFLNYIANKLFSHLFSWILVKDTPIPYAEQKSFQRKII